MNKGLRALLHILQVIFLLLAVLLLVESVTVNRADTTFLFGSEVPREQWALITGILSIACSPSLWSLARGGASAAAPQTMGSFDPVVSQPPAAPQPPQPGRPGQTGVGFEPMSSEQAPAPPASSYSQPSGPGYGAQPSAGGMTPASPPQGDTPWGGSR